MAHRPMPAYRASRGLWYVELNKRQIPLGTHPEGLPEPRKVKSRSGARGGWDPPEAFWREYHRVMADHSRDDLLPPPGEAPRPAVAEVLDEYVAWLKGQPHKAARTVKWYGGYLQSFLDSLPDQSITADRLTPRHVQRWLGLHPDWKTGRRGAGVAVQRAFNWSAREGLLHAAGMSSPPAGMEKPPQGKREQVISERKFEEILKNVRDENFEDLLVTAWETGARPRELFTVEASYVDEANSRRVFPMRLSKGKKVQRVVYLSGRALEITRRLAARNRTGPIFRNGDVEPWCQSSVK